MRAWMDRRRERFDALAATTAAGPLRGPRASSNRSSVSFIIDEPGSGPLLNSTVGLVASIAWFRSKNAVPSLCQLPICTPLPIMYASKPDGSGRSAASATTTSLPSFRRTSAIRWAIPAVPP